MIKPKVYKVKQIQSYLTNAYCICLCSLFLLYMEQGYFQITLAKYHCFIGMSLLYLCLMSVLYTYQGFVQRFSFASFRQRIKCLSLCDQTVLWMLCSHIITTLLSPYPLASLHGSMGRGMGLGWSLILSALYFMITRHLKQPHLVVNVLLGFGGLVCGLGIVQALGFDLFHLLSPLQGQDLNRFLSTIGNVTFYAHLLVLLIAISTMRFHYAQKRLRLNWGVYLCLFHLGVVLAHVDSAYLGLLILYGYHFIVYGKQREGLISLLWLLESALGAVIILQFLAHLDVSFYCEGISAHLIQSDGIALLFMASLIILYGLKRYEKSADFIPLMRKILFTLSGVIVLFLFGLILYVTWLAPNQALGSWSYYLRFDESWGSMRGFLWMTSLRVFFQEYSVMEQLFGKGLDCTRIILADALGTEVNTFPYDHAHNEYLQYAITGGWFALLSYLCFIAFTFRNLRQINEERDPRQGIRGALITHCAFAFTSLNQPITTPIVFLLIILANTHIATSKQG